MGIAEAKGSFPARPLVCRSFAAPLAVTEKMSSVTGEMSSRNQSRMTDTSTGQPKAPPKRICCACPDTRKLRDECIANKGEDYCTEYIEAHKVCLRTEGFKV